MHENQGEEKEEKRKEKVVGAKPDAFCPHKSLLYVGNVVKDNVCH
jgi:hypothetical protein